MFIFGIKKQRFGDRLVWLGAQIQPLFTWFTNLPDLTGLQLEVAIRQCTAAALLIFFQKQRNASSHEQPLGQTIHGIGSVIIIYVSALPLPCSLFFRIKDMLSRKTTTAKGLKWNQPTAVNLVQELRRPQVDVVPSVRWKKKTTKIRLVGSYYDNYHVPCFLQ